MTEEYATAFRWRRALAMMLALALLLALPLVPAMCGGDGADDNEAVAVASTPSQGQSALDHLLVPALGRPAWPARGASTTQLLQAHTTPVSLAAARAEAPASPWGSVVPRSRPSRAVRAARATLRRLLQPGRFAHYELVQRLSRRYAVEQRLVMAIIASESGGDPSAVSPSGAIGLMQLMPDTAERLGVDPWDPEQNVEGAVRYLSTLLASFHSVDLSLVAYNAGPGFAARYKNGEVDLGAETRAFLTRIGHLLQ